jgi:hypothetical protein
MQDKIDDIRYDVKIILSLTVLNMIIFSFIFLAIFGYAITR